MHINDVEEVIVWLVLVQVERVEEDEVVRHLKNCSLCIGVFIERNCLFIPISPLLEDSVKLGVPSVKVGVDPSTDAGGVHARLLPPLDSTLNELRPSPTLKKKKYRWILTFYFIFKE